ncbi:MAG: uracil-DNA glycosylase, partial [Thaumarchaeota archaeon]|nr:uracil-DNA glycosylase [Nitrososphaerota archaeon]
MTRCKICPCTRNRSPVLPSGPSPCRLLFIGEGPARHEDALGIPFVGDSGKEENEHYLPLAGLDRDSVAFCNAVYCSQPTYRNPTDKEAAICSSRHLPALLDRVRPEIIVPMGAVACSLFPSININIHHGRPQVGKYADWEGIVFPTYHPAAGLRSTAYMIPLRQDMKDLKELLRKIDEGSFEWPSDPYPNVDYRVARNGLDLMSYMIEDRLFELPTDTETLPDGSPYCLTISHTPGTGRLIYARDLHTIRHYSGLIRSLDPMLLFHNYLFDANPYGEMGIPILPGRFLDTMVRAYELCLGGGGDEDDSGGRGSLGLKTLAYRHLNMPMRSFKDTVLPHVLPKVLDWLSASSYLMAPDKRPPTCQCLHPSSSHEPRGKTQRHT